MNKLFPHMSDSPEKDQSLGALAYSIFPFVILPFTLMLFTIGVRNTEPYVFLEYLFQSINFLALFFIFRTYLQDSWLNVRHAPKQVLLTSLGAATAIAVFYGCISFAVYQEIFPQAQLVRLGMLPMTGIELMLLPGQFAVYGGLPAAVFLVLVGPVITACMFYAPVFSPLCVAGRRCLAYLCTATLLALPRIVTYFTIWGGWKEPQLYLAQLPIHMLACWTYQKTDTIWAPIFTHAIGNALSCAALFALKYAGIIY